MNLKPDVHQRFREGGKRPAPERPRDDELFQVREQVREAGCRLARERQAGDGRGVRRQQGMPAFRNLV